MLFSKGVTKEIWSYTTIKRCEMGKAIDSRAFAAESARETLSHTCKDRIPQTFHRPSVSILQLVLIVTRIGKRGPCTLAPVPPIAISQRALSHLCQIRWVHQASSLDGYQSCSAMLIP